MKLFSRRNILYLIIFFCCFGFALSHQLKEMKKVSMTTVFFDKWAFSGRSSEMLKKMSLGYDIVLADLLWLRTIQSFGGRGMSQRDWKPVYYQFDTLTDIDPSMESAYSFGNMVIGDEGRHQKEGLDIINKGMKNLPYRYRVPFEGMYVSNWTLKNQSMARWYGKVAVKALNAPDWLPRMVAYLDIEAGQYFVGVDQYLGNFLQGLQTEQSHILNLGIARLADAIDKWNKSIMDKALADYEESHNDTAPRSLEDLNGTETISSGYKIIDFKRVLALVDTIQRRLNKQGLSAELIKDYMLPSAGDFEWADTVTTKSFDLKTKLTDLQNDIFNLSIMTKNKLPDSPYVSPYVWNPMFAKPRSGMPEQPIMTESKRLETLGQMLKTLKEEIKNFQSREQRLPISLYEVFETEFVTPEPYGGEWLYDNKTGDIKSSTHMDLELNEGAQNEGQ